MTTSPNTPDAPSETPNSELPTPNFLTAALPGVGGEYKSHPDDFEVDEIPLYDASGEGTHVYFQLTKRNRTTMDVVAQISRALGRRPAEIGYAGLKDKRALTRQWMSVEHIDPQRIEALDLADIRIDQITSHTNKLRTGHLWGNRFDLKLRRVCDNALDRARAILDVLVARGVPNFFGSQRFGVRGNGWKLGRFLLVNDSEGFVREFVGRPMEGELPKLLEARSAFEDGRFADALALWPSRHRDERRVLTVLVRGKTPHRAMRAVDKTLRRFLISAYQSHLFNRVLTERLDQLDVVLDGDLAYRHDRGAVFRVEDATVEQPRAAAQEISPTGPIFGYRMTQPEGEPARIEQAVLDAENLTLESFREQGRIRIKGGRRPLRFIPTDASVSDGTDKRGPFLRVQFTLPSGCYATIILEEITKLRTRPLADPVPNE